MSETDGETLLFAYAALLLPQVQLDTFGRLVDGDQDVLSGYTVDYIDLDDPRVSAAFGRPEDRILRATGSAYDKVVGTALRLAAEELDAADEYEITGRRRIQVQLASGRTAWVYVWS